MLEDYFEHYNPNSYLVFISNKDTIDSRKKLVKLISSKGVSKKIEATDEYLNKYKEAKSKISLFFKKANM